MQACRRSAKMLLGCLTVLGLLLAGCTNIAIPWLNSPPQLGSENPTGARFTPVGVCEADRTPPEPNATIGKGSDMTLAWIPSQQGLSPFEANAAGANKAGAEIGVAVHYTAPATVNATDQAQIIADLVNSSNPPDVIAFSTNDPTMIAEELIAAKKRGILVVGMDYDVAASARDLFIQSTSYSDMGESFVDAAVEKYGDSGTIGIISTTPEATIQNEWIRAITEYGNATYPNLVFEAPTFSDSNAAQSMTETIGLMNQHQDLLAVFAFDSFAVAGAIAAVKANGKSGKIGIWGVSTPKSNARYFEDKSLDGLWYWDEEKKGEFLAYVARGICDNKIPQAGTFLAGALGEYEVIPEPATNTIIFSPPLLIDQTNYKNYDF